MQNSNASKATLGGQQFFRINQEIVSSGDLWELDTSIAALAIGPDSDVDSVKLSYLDDTVPGNVNSMVVSVGSPLIGRLDALNGSPVPGASGTVGKIIVSLNDLIDTSYTPYTYTVGAGQDTVNQAEPKIDLLAYLSPQSQFPVQRANKTYRLPVIGSAQSTTPPKRATMIPFYGRRSGKATFINQSGVDPAGASGGTAVIRAYGIKLNYGGTPAGGNTSSQTLLGSANIATANGSVDVVWSAAEFGQFDMIQVELEYVVAVIGIQQMFLYVEVSDKEGGVI